MPFEVSMDVASFAQGLRRLAEAGVTAAEAARGMQEAMMNLADVTTAPMNAYEATLHEYLQGRHLMVVQRNDFQAGFEMVCRICGDRVLFIPQDAVRVRALRVTLDQIDVMAGEHHCQIDRTKIDRAVEPDPVRMIRFKR